MAENKLIKQLGIQEGDLIRAGGFAEVFAFKDGQFQHQSDPEALKEAFGQDAFRRVRDIGEQQARDLGLNFETRLPAGSFEELGLDINNLDTEALAQGQQLSSIREKAAQARPGQAPLISSPGDERIFRINPETGEREHIENPDALLSLGRTFDEVIEVMPEVLNVFRDGQSINAVMGEVFKEVNMQKNIENMMGVDEIKKKRDAKSEKLLKALEDLPSLIAEERDDLREEFKLKERSELLTAMDEQIADFRNDAMVAQELIMSQPVSMAFITGQTAAMTRIANVQLQTMFSKREAVAGDFDRATRLYEQAFSEHITLEQMRIDTMSTSLEIIQSKLSDEDAKVARLMDRALQSEQLRLDRKREDQASLREMMLTYPFAGITMDDNPNSAATKINKYFQDIGNNQFSVQMMGDGSILEIKTDATTGEVIDVRTVKGPSFRGGGGGGGSGGGGGGGVVAGGGGATMTERALSSASARLEANRGVGRPEGDTAVRLDNYMVIRSQTALDPSQFDARFAQHYLSPEDAQTLSSMTNANTCTNEDIAAGRC